jgi:hypothetical protein
MAEFRWLHLSDCHIGRSDDQVAWPSVRQLLRDDLSRLADTIGSFDVVIFTGDLTQKGNAHEFQRFEEEFLHEVWDAVGSPDTAFIAIPGNHDLARPSPKSAAGLGLVGSADARDGMFRGDEESLAFIKARFAGYAEWWEKNTHRPQDRYRGGVLPGDFTYVHEKNGLTIGFVGLNSTWLQLFDGMDEGSLAVDIRQIQPACSGDLHSWTRRHTLNFLLTHQPASWLNPDYQKAFNEFIAPPGRFIAHLFGHMHEARTESTRRGGGQTKWTCQAPSLFGLEKVQIVKEGTVTSVEDRRYGYIAGQLDVEHGGASIKLWPRRGVKTQDETWRIASDYSFHLENDFANVPAESVMLSGGRSPATVTQTTDDSAPIADSDWLSCAEASELWRPLPRFPGYADALALLRELVSSCVDAWTRVAQTVPDPWRDGEWAPRTLARTADYLRGLTQEIEPEASILLIAAPFLRAAILATGVAKLMEARPFDFARAQNRDSLRRRIEREHLAHETLLQRVDQLNEDDRRAVVMRLVNQAVRRWPALWRAEPGLVPVAVADAVKALEKRLFSGYNGSRFMALARSTGGEPALIALADEGLHAVNLAGKVLAPRELASLLSVAGQAALDPGVANSASVEHIGLDPDFALGELLEAVRRARWMRDNRRHVLQYQSPSQVVDFALREFVASADATLVQITSEHAAAERPRLLTGLPERLSPDGIVPAVKTGRESYRLPHIRFQLDHGRIRDLLMGERLYGDASLAIRELYQNALDACRYRRVRQECATKLEHYYGDPYQGRITLREGEAYGRPYIECCDNGVGMTEHTLERVFAIAGRRFHDSPEYAEEHADWERLGLTNVFVPNSQFGIGVLSYFMLADELEVRTRPFLRDGRLGDPLIARISSAAGLFRLRKSEDVETGTTIRLYLGPRARGVHCRDVLSTLLWIAEFETVVESGDGGATVWHAGRPGPVGSGRDIQLREAMPGVAWWSAKANIPVLADGIATDETHELLLLNLSGFRYPRLSVDRKHIMGLDLHWTREIVASTRDRLVDWDQTSLELLGRLEDEDAISARAVETAITLSRSRVRADFKSQDDFPLSEHGCFSADAAMLGLQGKSPHTVVKIRSSRQSTSDALACPGFALLWTHRRRRQLSPACCDACSRT